MEQVFPRIEYMELKTKERQENEESTCPKTWKGIRQILKHNESGDFKQPSLN